MKSRIEACRVRPISSGSVSMPTTDRRRLEVFGHATAEQGDMDALCLMGEIDARRLSRIAPLDWSRSSLWDLG